MRKTIFFLAATLILTGCASGEPQEIRGPVTVAELRAEAQQTAEKVAEPDEESCVFEIADAVIATPEPTQETDPLPEMPISEEEMSVLTGKVIEIEEICQKEPEICSDFPEGEYGNYYENLPGEDSQVWQYEETTPEEPGMELLGIYHITHYSAEACGNAIGAAEVEGGLVEGTSIAMPEAWMLGHWFYIEGYGTFRADDISPDGVADIFHWYAADAVGNDYQNVWLID